MQIKQLVRFTSEDLEARTGIKQRMRLTFLCIDKNSQEWGTFFFLTESNNNAIPGEISGFNIWKAVTMIKQTNKKKQIFIIERLAV